MAKVIVRTPGGEVALVANVLRYSERVDGIPQVKVLRVVMCDNRKSLNDQKPKVVSERTYYVEDFPNRDEIAWQAVQDALNGGADAVILLDGIRPMKELESDEEIELPFVFLKSKKA